MAGERSSASNPLLSGLFGVFQNAALNRVTTADVWQSLQMNAGAYAYQARGLPVPNDDQLVQEAGRQVLRSQGVSVAQVNTYRGLASEWLSAKNSLKNLDPGDQIGADSIFRPPWATTAQQGVPDRYRVRVQWQVEPTEGDSFTSWSTYELDSPLTSLQDILDQAGALVGKKPTSAVPLGAVVTGANDYELEQI